MPAGRLPVARWNSARDRGKRWANASVRPAAASLVTAICPLLAVARGRTAPCSAAPLQSAPPCREHTPCLAWRQASALRGEVTILKSAPALPRRVCDSSRQGTVLECAQEKGTMSTEQPSPGAALAEWFDDTSASEEVQALRAWVAGLSGELAQARQDRDEAQRALQAALAELDRLRAELAEVAVRRAEAAQAEVGLAERPAPLAEAGATQAAAAAADADGAPGSLPSEAPRATPPTDLAAARRSRTGHSSDEITVEVLEA